jgi:DNA-binding XRE family transcriptional regulator
MRKHPTKGNNSIIDLHHAGVLYRVPIKVVEKYRIQEDSISAEDVFTEINKKYTKPGALLRGIRARENLTQTAMAKKMGVTQSDISQMENGVRKIGRKIAMRIQKHFGLHYRIFLD